MEKIFYVLNINYFIQNHKVLVFVITFQTHLGIFHNSIDRFFIKSIKKTATNLSLL